jgi:nucleotide-binding universal stress UspA family protein
MGLSRHSPARRLMPGTVARVVRSTSIPVLAVATTARALPRVAVVGVDFSVASRAAIAHAKAVLDRPAMLYLVHVRPSVRASISDVSGWDDVYDAGVRRGLDRFCAELTDDEITVFGRIDSGGIVDSLLRVAHDVGADLIACGSDHLGTLERLILGRVPNKILRGADCSVLIAPCAQQPNNMESSACPPAPRQTSD